MSNRLWPALGLLLLATGCGSDIVDQPTTPELPAGGLFAYAYEPGTTYTYGFTLNQALNASFEAEGDPSFLSDGEPPPGDVEAEISISGTVTYDVASGPEPDTYAISISGTFDEVSVTGIVDGEPIEDELDLEETGTPDLVQVPDLLIVVDSQGHVLRGELEGQELPELDLFADPFSALQDLTSGGLNGHFGPSFPDEPLKVGTSWTDSYSEDVFEQTFSTETTYTVTGVEVMDGAEVAVIDVVRSSSGLTLDLGELFMAFFEGFAAMGEEAEGEGTPALDEIDLTFLVSVAPSDGTGTVWFDPVAGVTRRIEQQTAASIDMDFSVDDGTQAGSVRMEMAFDVDLSAALEG